MEAAITGPQHRVLVVQVAAGPVEVRVGVPVRRDLPTQVAAVAVAGTSLATGLLAALALLFCPSQTCTQPLSRVA